MLRCSREGELVNMPGLACVYIVTDRDEGVVELHRRNVDNVAPKNQLLALAFDHIHGVSGRVPMRCLRTDARHEVGIAIEDRRIEVIGIFRNEDVSGPKTWVTDRT